MQKRGISLAPADLLIATHVLDAGAVMVTHDQAFRRVPNLRIED